MLDKVKLYLKIDFDDLDSEIADLIEEAKADLILSGISKKKIEEEDILVQRAIKIFCKAEYSDTKDSERYKKSYEMLKDHLSLSMDYVGDSNAFN